MSLCQALQFSHLYNILKLQTQPFKHSNINTNTNPYIKPKSKPKPNKRRLFQSSKVPNKLQQTPSLSLLLSKLQQQSQHPHHIDTSYFQYSSRSPQNHSQYIYHHSDKKDQSTLTEKHPSDYSGNILDKVQSTPRDRLRTLQYIREAAKTNPYFLQIYNYQTTK